MTTPVVRILHHSNYLPDDDLITLFLATNVDKNFLVIEALAGTGKTTLFLDVIRRLDCERCIVLSFSKTAVKVIRVRLKQAEGTWLQSQTFDSLFLHLHGKRVQERIEQPTFEDYRDMVVATTAEDLNNFICRTKHVNYAFQDFDYVFVDEAQDSPPEAYDFLNLCRRMGKHVIITGDQHQAIFRFMNTSNLFERIPSCHAVSHKLTVTRRCVQPICDYVNERFALTMSSVRTDRYDPRGYLNVSFQCRLNTTMGQLYVTILSTIMVRVEVNVAETEGESEDRFRKAALAEVCQRYGVTAERAEEILKLMQERSASCKGPSITLSTVHRYKGDESDLTVLAYDLDIDAVSDDVYEENLKYVACTRPRFGLLHTVRPRHIGDRGPLEKLAIMFRKRTISFSSVANVSQLVSSPILLVRLMGDPTLRRYMSLVEDAYQRRSFHEKTERTQHPPACRSSSLVCATLVGSACDVAIAWLLERQAYTSNVVNTFFHYPEFGVTTKLDRKLQATINAGKVDASVANVYRKLIVRLKTTALLCRYLVVRHGYQPHSSLIAPGIICATTLNNFSSSRSVLTLQREVPRCCVADYCNTMAEVTLPPLLQDGHSWQAISIHSTVPDNPILLRATFDVVIYDKTGRTHILEIKCVKSLRFSHFWQSLMYAVLCQINGGTLVHHAYVYSVRDSTLVSLPSDSISAVSHELAANRDAFNCAILTRTDPQFYPKEYNPSDLLARIDAVSS